nr:MAG TPA: hypothetical protein [Caudoviricetes sp.]
MWRGRSRYHIISLLPFLFCVIYGLVRYDIRSAPPRNFLCGIYRLDKWHSSKKEPLSELLYTNNPN